MFNLRCYNVFRELQNADNGDTFDVQNEQLENFPSLKVLRLRGCRRANLSFVLGTLRNLRYVTVEIGKTCESCNYTKAVSRREPCPQQRCVFGENSLFDYSYCTCVVCTRMENCTDGLPERERFLGDKTAVRVALWVITSSALISNIALIITRIFTHSYREKPLNIFILGLAFSNLFITGSVMVLLVADSHHMQTFDDKNWPMPICSPVYLLKHFGIYSLVIVLILIILERFSKLGFKLCFALRLSFRRSVLYMCETWVLSFLLIIPPWTRITSWQNFCIANYDMVFATSMYIACGLLELVFSFVILLQICVLLWRRIATSRSTICFIDIRSDISLILAGFVTFSMLGVPHGVVAITQMTDQEPNTEIVTILLGCLSFFHSLIFFRYSPLYVHPSDTLSTKDMDCTCEKCTLKRTSLVKFSLDSLKPSETVATLTATRKDRSNDEKSSSLKRMSADSLLDIETWTSQSSKTKSWIESCDYEDVRKLKMRLGPRKVSLAQSSHGEGELLEVTCKSRASTWCDRYACMSTSTSGVNDVSSGTTSIEHVSNNIAHDRLSFSSENVREVDKPGSRGCIFGEHEITLEHTSSERKPRSKRLSSFCILIRALSPNRQRSKSLTEKPKILVKKFKRSQSVPSIEIHHHQTQFNDREKKCDFSQDETKPGLFSLHEKPKKQTYKERLTSFFVLSPSKSHKRLKRRASSPEKKNDVEVARNNPQLTKPERGRSQSCVPAISSQEVSGDTLTELPVMRRAKPKTKACDMMSRLSSNSTNSTKSTRFSMEWDPIGSMEGYDENDVLPPFPNYRPNKGRLVKREVSVPASEVQTSDSNPVVERTSMYSLDWDPTSVQMRCSIVSRDSLTSLDDITGNEHKLYDIQNCQGPKKTVWV